MRFILRTLHGVLDYIVGALLLYAPTLFGFSHVEAARNVAWTLGGAALLYSLMTALRALREGIQNETPSK